MLRSAQLDGSTLWRFDAKGLGSLCVFEGGRGRSRVTLRRCPYVLWRVAASIAEGRGINKAFAMHLTCLGFVSVLLLCLSVFHVQASPTHAIVAYISEPAFAAKLDAGSAPWAASVTWLCMQDAPRVRFSLHVSAEIEVQFCPALCNCFGT